MSTRASCAVPIAPGAAGAVAAGRVRLRPLEAATYQRHALHGEDRTWPETNCYVDLWIEVVHGLGLDPMPALPFTLALDFEGDQYTFYKFGHTDLHDLYGVDVQELNIWKPLVEHAVEQVAMGRVLIPEVDSFWLPDTAGVSYRIDHTKSSIAIQDVDVAARRLGYFHGASYYQLEGEDFDGVFRLAAGLTGPNVLPPYTEIAKLDKVEPLSDAALTERSISLTRRYIARRPATNPIARHYERFARDLEWLRESNSATLFHQYAFATFRQLGSCFEVACSYLQWLGSRGERGLEAPATDCDTIAKTSKALQFKLARAATLKRQIDVAESFESMITGWESAMKHLVARYGS